MLQLPGTMNVPTRFALIFLLVASGLAACSPELPPPAPSATPTIRLTLEPTLTPTLFPSATPVPTDTPTLTPTPAPTLTPTPILFAAASTPLPPGLEAISLSNAAEVSALGELRLEAVTALAWAPDGKTLAISHLDGIAFFDASTREQTRALYPRGERVVDLAFSPQGDWLLAGSLYGSEAESWASDIQFWRGPYWQPLGIGLAETRGLTAIEFAPKGGLFAAAFALPGYEEDTIEIFNTTSWEVTSTLKLGQVEEIAFSQDGELLASTPDRYGIQIYSLKEQERLLTLPTSFSGAVNCMSFAPNLPLLATGHYDGVIRIWDVSTGLVMATFDTRSNSVIESLAFSPDGLLLANGESYATNLVRLWEVDSGELLRTLEGHESGVVDLRFSPDSLFLASGSYDGLVRLWGLRP